jgi:protein-S-isoprenylcysteine O-methyltransferase Ste14
LPAVGAWIHRDVVREERRLEEKFRDDYRRYRAATGRYVPKL